MERRTFLELIGGAAAGAALSPLGAFAAARPPGFRAWTWVHGGGKATDADWRARFERLRDGGFSGVCVGGGDTAALAAAAHAAGLTFHAWTWIMNRNGDAWVKEHHPEWFDVSRNGDSSLNKPPYVPYYQWLCPTRPEVRAYLRGIVDQVAQVPGVDAVHLDYIRHPDVILPRGLWSKYNLVQDHEMPEFDFCYCDVCRAAFEKASGVDPFELPDPTADVRWREFRWNSITGVVRVLAEAVHARNRQISAAVFPTPTIARRLVRQAWDQWPLDAVFPMTYHGFYEEDVAWIGTSVREGVRALPDGRPLYAGLYLPDCDPPTLDRAIRTARDAGAAGFSCFDSNGLTDAHLEVVRRAVA